ncbi:hypothetical protein [Caenimonas sedimenti]|uniref:hypothetical protein n=1 Tax=Caenimonas sedimenti TaxID=2596921 RepID=UPI0016484DDC|nr:hypothetical protein [Caenimonas sedimenti]
MRTSMSRAERMLLLATSAGLLLALFGPSLAPLAHAHDFADQRALWGVPYALDVLSNLPFALLGLLGGWTLLASGRGVASPVQRALAGLFFAGLVVTAAGSSWYHLHADDAGLAVDRYAMGVAFAGLLGLAVATRVSDRAGAALAGALLLLAPLAAHTAFAGNLAPWVVVQFGGMLVLLALVFAPTRPGAVTIRLGWVLVAYGVAKLTEMGDHVIFEATAELLAGHTVKHLLAAAAAIPVLAPFLAAARSGQNGAQSSAGTHAAVAGPRQA